MPDTSRVKRSWLRRRGIAIAALAAGGVALAATVPSFAAETDHAGGSTATPIQHLVFIFQENVSFDHYFGTYPNAANTDGTPFQASAGTPTVNGLTQALLS